ncbi:PREDICTED: pancreatic triacylglycerol lipase-like [Dufourea novaeangliae]|uniref:pancreatic triacylglycerol lipase-like n=1 Tax=Dufourea novaeangliae TaxID=178035 RepID=UPI0007677501|nr:PREDICTED: pancreatic triacylglycerol lipase-like [Dufourea novaeangliae]
MQLNLNKCFIFLVLIILGSTEAIRSAKLLAMKNRVMLRRKAVTRDDLKQKVCYDLVGCFVDPPPHLTLKRPPQHPNVIQTRFLLYTRAKRDSPDGLQYGDDFRSISKSKFDAKKPLKVIIHGYKGSGSDVGSILLVQALLDMDDVNVLVLDWTRGAATTYSAAVANTELVGRQLGLVLLDTVNLGTPPENIHVIGFSLGAHIAGCASEILKKNTLLLGRITGLDPASPFFRNHLLREKSRKLDATDAQLVDVIHTDGSEDFADGFGLLKPLGHIDFFPNGGREQPGCNDVKNSVVVSHLNEDSLTKELACSHLRAWRVFLESVRTANESCKFTAWPCPKGRNSYMNGMCFPMESTFWNQEMGYKANQGALGIYYLPTREDSPLCGEPYRASVAISEDATRTSGMLFLKIGGGNSTTIFKIRCPLSGRNNRMTFYNIAALGYQSFADNPETIEARVWYQSVMDKTQNDSRKHAYSDMLFVNKLALEDRKGNRWQYCKPNTAVDERENLMILQREKCDVS